jgi:hypothetical protein
MRWRRRTNDPSSPARCTTTGSPAAIRSGYPARSAEVTGEPVLRHPVVSVVRREVGWHRSVPSTQFIR